ncbi:MULTISPECIES: rod shape-determining protein MreB [Clostridium]|uniref:Cell shape-determining protein MreB n=1 Tax=Clostridium cibarium TaxID=2762247 RepID=A0ABR8PWX8_9CLOT|nr:MULTISPECIES: rod shape-determining protein MreB [Clostridium]MBD7912661.1 rod shape-determining protein MreB [Clostridium cibarium]
MWFLRRGAELGIDLGTATVLIYEKGKGVILKEPSVVAINKNNNKILAVGEDARKMIGRTPGNIVAVRPLRDGVISDYDITEKMLKEFIKKAVGKKNIVAPNVVVCIPSQATEVEKRAVIDATRNSGAKRVHIIEEPLAAAVGAGIEVTRPNGAMVVDIGGGTCDIAIISLGGVVVRKSIKVAGNRFDEAIIKYIRTKYKIMIGEKTAEDLKINVATAFKGNRNLITTMKGRNLVSGLPDEIEVSTDEIRQALQESTYTIVESVKAVLESSPPELAADIMEKGILMTGGGALLDGLDKLIEFETGVSVYVAEDSVECVVEGTGKMLSLLDKLDFSENSQEITLIFE